MWFIDRDFPLMTLLKTRGSDAEQTFKVKVSTIEPKKYTKGRLDELVDSLYAVHCKIFDGVDRDTFIHYVLFPTAKYTKIHLLRNAQQELVGYFSLHHFEKLIEQRNVVVIRGETGILPEYRRHHIVLTIIIKELVLNKLLYLFREVYVLGCFVHPIMYYSIAKNAYRIYPNCRYETPRKINSLMFELADEFHLKETNEANPFVRDIGWITKESDVDRSRLRDSKKKEIQYYLEHNPHYEKGYGLETFIPLSLTNALLTICNFVISHFGFKFRFYAKN